MDNHDTIRPFISNLFQSVRLAYSIIPYRFFPAGHAFPAWHYGIELTRRCNLRCIMCQHREFLRTTSPSEQGKDELSTDEWHHIMGQIPRFCLVSFTGGEPFVRNDFMEIFEAASRTHRTHYISNLTIAGEGHIEQTVKLAPRHLGGIGCNVVGTSVEGPPEVHDYIRVKLGSYQKTFTAIRSLRKNRDLQRKKCPKLWVTAVIQKDNVDVLPLLPKLVAEMGADGLNLTIETRVTDHPELGDRDPREWNSSDFSWPSIDAGILEESLNRTIAAAKDIEVELRLPRIPRREIIAYYQKSTSLKDYYCMGAWNGVLIAYDGDVYPCLLLRVGNVRTQTMKTIWNGESMRDFRNEVRKRLFAPCAGCCFLEYKGMSGDR